MTGLHATQRGTAVRSDARATPARGRLIVVAAADPTLRDVMLQVVAQRLATHDVVFAEPLATRRLPAGGGTVVSRNDFVAAARSGALALTWQCGSQGYGHSLDIEAHLAAGRTVVAGIDSSCSDAACELWPDVHLIRLYTRIDRLRTGASRHRTSAGIAHDGTDPVATVRALSAAIAGHLPQPAESGRKAGRPAATPPVPLALSRALRRAAKSQAAGHITA